MEVHGSMTREDAKKILQMFQISYPHSYSNMDADEARLFLQLWTDAFKNIPTKVVFDAVKDYIYNTDEKFAPNVGQIRTTIVKNLAPDVEQTAIHAWEQFRKFISSVSSWATIEEEEPKYKKLDPITRRLYTHREARSLAQLDKNVLEYRRSEFIKLYQNILYKENEKAMNRGDLVTLAGGQERFVALGYSTENLLQLEGGVNGAATRKEHQD